MHFVEHNELASYTIKVTLLLLLHLKLNAIQRESCNCIQEMSRVLKCFYSHALHQRAIYLANFFFFYVCHVDEHIFESQHIYFFHFKPLNLRVRTRQINK